MWRAHRRGTHRDNTPNGHEAGSFGSTRVPDAPLVSGTANARRSYYRKTAQSKTIQEFAKQGTLEHSRRQWDQSATAHRPQGILTPIGASVSFNFRWTSSSASVWRRLSQSSFLVFVKCGRDPSHGLPRDMAQHAAPRGPFCRVCSVSADHSKRFETVCCGLRPWPLDLSASSPDSRWRHSHDIR